MSKTKTPEDEPNKPADNPAEKLPDAKKKDGEQKPPEAGQQNTQQYVEIGKAINHLEQSVNAFQKATAAEEKQQALEDVKKQQVELQASLMADKLDGTIDTLPESRRKAQEVLDRTRILLEKLNTVDLQVRANIDSIQKLINDQVHQIVDQENLSVWEKTLGNWKKNIDSFISAPLRWFMPGFSVGRSMKKALVYGKYYLKKYILFGWAGDGEEELAELDNLSIEDEVAAVVNLENEKAEKFNKSTRQMGNQKTKLVLAENWQEDPAYAKLLQKFNSEAAKLKDVDKKNWPPYLKGIGKYIAHLMKKHMPQLQYGSEITMGRIWQLEQLANNEYKAGPGETSTETSTEKPSSNELPKDKELTESTESYHYGENMIGFAKGKGNVMQLKVDENSYVFKAKPKQGEIVDLSIISAMLISGTHQNTLQLQLVNTEKNLKATVKLENKDATQQVLDGKFENSKLLNNYTISMETAA